MFQSPLLAHVWSGCALLQVCPSRPSCGISSIPISVFGINLKRELLFFYAQTFKGVRKVTRLIFIAAFDFHSV